MFSFMAFLVISTPFSLYLFLFLRFSATFRHVAMTFGICFMFAASTLVDGPWCLVINFFLMRSRFLTILPFVVPDLNGFPSQHFRHEQPFLLGSCC